jgi:hypothetical protein
MPGEGMDKLDQARRSEQHYILVSLCIKKDSHIFFLRSGKGTQIGEECFDTSESKQNASKLFPAVSAIADKP